MRSWGSSLLISPKYGRSFGSSPSSHPGKVDLWDLPYSSHPSMRDPWTFLFFSTGIREILRVFPPFFDQVREILWVFPPLLTQVPWASVRGLSVNTITGNLEEQAFQSIPVQVPGEFHWKILMKRRKIFRVFQANQFSNIFEIKHLL